MEQEKQVFDAVTYILCTTLMNLFNSKHGGTLQNLPQMLHLWIQTILTGVGTG